jgi:peptidoglycan hydrolase-like protein with peptidoglycan-binding domain
MQWKLTAIAALVLVPSLALAQQDTTMRDTSRVESSAEGRLGQPMAARNHGLTTDQVRQLQEAINRSGCNAGPATGTVDDKTLAGIQCVRTAKNIQSNNLNDVLRALNLSFTAPDSLLPETMPGKPQDSTMMHDTSAVHDTTLMRHDTTAHRPRRR